ncbi:MAG: hypothetical protein LBO79_08205 [Zoogloeaceae bacterium]|jgi:hypothetical protein|nr:hypothetical protein [Zoogloeaceae bacterium]
MTNQTDRHSLPLSTNEYGTVHTVGVDSISNFRVAQIHFDQNTLISVLFRHTSAHLPCLALDFSAAAGMR